MKVYGVTWNGCQGGFEVAGDHKSQVVAYVSDVYGIDKRQVKLEPMGELVESALADEGVINAVQEGY